MTTFIENIRKIMGWCPNANAFEIRKPVQFDNIPAGASGGIGGAMKKIAEQPKIKEALLIVGIFGILNAVGLYLTSDKITFVFEGSANFERPGVLGALAAPFILWMVCTGLIQFISKVLGGKGKFYPQMMTIVGYSFIPLLFAALINHAVFFMMEPMTITISPGNPAVYREIYYAHPLEFASTIIAIIMQALVSIILFFGIRSAQKLTAIRSAVVAGIPFMFSILSTAWTFRNAGMI